MIIIDCLEKMIVRTLKTVVVLGWGLLILE